MSDVIETKPAGLYVATPHANRSERWLQEQIKRSRREGVFTLTAKLTPELAELLLENNDNNRRLSGMKIRDYARDIEAGDWLHNGQTLVIAKTGELNDGQHRCEAVVRAGMSIVTEMVFGVERETRKTLDTGIRRTIGQHLAMSGVPYAHNIGAIARIMITFNTYQDLPSISSSGGRPTTAQILAWVDEHRDEALAALLVVEQVYKATRFSKSLAAALCMLFSRRNTLASEKFFEKLASGAELAPDDPIYRLREAVLKSGRVRGRHHLPERWLAGMAIKAWNAYRDGKSVKQLMFRGDEAFPQPK